MYGPTVCMGEFILYIVIVISSSIVVVVIISLIGICLCSVLVCRHETSCMQKTVGNKQTNKRTITVEGY